MACASAWNQAARALLAKRPLPLHEEARLLRDLNAAIFDAYVVAFEAKYFYVFWRPVTAIRNGDEDDNPATGRDAHWRPLLPTPRSPAYPCARCAAGAAALSVLERAFGRGGAGPVRIETPDGARTFTGLAALADEIDESALWAGAQYRFGIEAGREAGRRVAEALRSRAAAAAR